MNIGDFNSREYVAQLVQIEAPLAHAPHTTYSNCRVRFEGSWCVLEAQGRVDVYPANQIAGVIGLRVAPQS